MEKKETRGSKETPPMPVDFWHYPYNPITGFPIEIKRSKAVFRKIPYENKEGQ